MSVLMIGQKERDLIAQAIVRARANVIPWAAIRNNAAAIDQTTDTITLEDRERAGEKISRHTSVQRVVIPVGFCLAISCEEQPAGILAHLSLSVDGKVPSKDAFKIVVEACGLDFDNAARGWIEEFRVNGRSGFAANALWLIEPRPDHRTLQ